jgi:glycosyltransferase involved in cell wall biosynthesis
LRVLLVNAFHYLKGGVERTYLDESRWLSAAGHDVAHLAIRDPRNLPSPTSAYFAPPADFGEGAPALRQLVQLPRALWSAPAARAMGQVLRAFGPEIAHLHAPSRYLTPSILRPLARAAVPTVMTLHDFKPWCTNRIMFAHGTTCERCRGGTHWHALATGCVQGSRLKSAVGTLEAYTHDAIHAYRHVRHWIAPSQFVFDKALEWGLSPESLRVLQHGVEQATADRDEIAIPDRPYVLFAGRLSVEKGVALLPALAAGLGTTPLLVAGDGPLRRKLEEAARGATDLRVLGHLSDAALARLRAHAAVVVVPSLFYEHFCYAAAEALLDRRPVVASRIGAIPELIEHEVTGLLAPPGDAGALVAAVKRALEDPAAAAWGAAGEDRVRRVANPERHVDALLSIYRETMAAP